MKTPEEKIEVLTKALESMRSLARMAEYHICSGNRGCLGEQALYHRTMSEANQALAIAKLGLEIPTLS